MLWMPIPNMEMCLNNRSSTQILGITMIMMLILPVREIDLLIMNDPLALNHFTYRDVTFALGINGQVFFQVHVFDLQIGV